MFVQALGSGEDARVVALGAAREVLAGLGGAMATSVLVFSTDTYPSDIVLAAVREVFGNVPLAGCSAPGVFACGRVTHDGVAVIASSSLEITPVAVDGVGEDSRAVAAAAMTGVMDVLEREGRTLEGPEVVMLLLPDGIVGNSYEVAHGVVSVVGGTVRCTGGGTGDDWKFQQTQQYCNDEVHVGSALTVALSCSSQIGVALGHGCEPWGPPMLVTQVEGRMLGGLDFVPALDRYAEVVTEMGLEGFGVDNFTQFATLHPLGIVQGDAGEFVLRSPLMIGESGDLACCADFPVNATVRVMEGTPESMLVATRETARSARLQLGETPPAAVLVFSCISRDLVLGSDEAGLSKELEAVREGVGADVPIFGCITFGSYGTLGAGLSQYQSKSISVCVLPGA